MSANDAAIAEGMRLARRAFEKRGNQSEAHLTEGELAAMLALAFESGQHAGRVTERAENIRDGWQLVRESSCECRKHLAAHVINFACDGGDECCEQRSESSASSSPLEK